MGHKGNSPSPPTYTPIASDQNDIGRGPVRLAIHTGIVIVPVKEVCDVVSIHIVSII